MSKQKTIKAALFPCLIFLIVIGALFRPDLIQRSIDFGKSLFDTQPAPNK
jgi:hypothetical protein